MAFWNKEGEPTDPNPDGAAGDLLLGAGAEFEGKLTFAGTVRIDAKFKGSIVTNDVLVVGDRARIDADITCGTVIVHGEVNGNIKAKTAVELHAPAKVRGDIETPSLAMEKGVLFQGQSTMPAEGASFTVGRSSALPPLDGEGRGSAAPPT
jgi:cytoskeletal protein CcmA (bactofilin family)